MRSLVSSLILCVALGAQAPAPRAADEKPARVEGEVRDAVTGAPIERAHVIARRFISGNQWERYAALTAADGTFAIERIAVPSGGSAFEIRMDHAGYVDLSPSNAAQLRLVPGESRTGYKLKLTPTGALAGRVRDSSGAVVEGISVAALSGGRKQGSAVTDDRGAFRIGGLPPGKYRLQAHPLNLPTPPEIRTDGTAEIHHSPTFYPAELDARNATRVEVRPATEVTGLEIQLVRTPILRVSGKVSGAPSGAQTVVVSLRLTEGQSNNGGQARSDGSFELWRVDPGKYTVSASYYTPAGSEEWASAPVEIEVGANDLEGIALQLMPPVEIHGSSVFEDEDARTGPQPPKPPQGAQQSQAPPPPQRPRRNVQLREARTGNTVMSSPLDEDGTFVFNRVKPGVYKVVIQPSPTYVKAMEFGETHFNGAELDLRSGAAAPLTLHLATAAGAIAGVVRDKDGPAARVRVFLVEAGGRSPSSIVMSDKDGTYSFPRVSPGKYRLLATDESESYLSLVDEDLEDIADVVEIGDRQSVTRDLRKYEPGKKP